MNCTLQNSHCCLDPIGVVSYFGVGCSLESEERLRESSKGKRKKVEGEDRKKSEITNLRTYSLVSERGNLRTVLHLTCLQRAHIAAQIYLHLSTYVMESY